MKTNAYAIFDTASGAFMQPFFMPTDGMAFRAFTDHVNSTEPNNVSKHPEHFSLYYIGTWDDTSGDLEPANPARRLITANELVQRNELTISGDKAEQLIDQMQQALNRLDDLYQTLAIDELKENKA